MKLSEKQKEVVAKMREGWHCAYYYGSYPNVTLQHGGIGKGGDCKKFRLSILKPLIAAGFIKKSSVKNPAYTKHILTELGKTIKL